MSRYNPRSVPPTKAQKEFIHKVKCLPCIVEHLDWYKNGQPVSKGFGSFGTVSDAHHITEGMRRLGHDYLLPLCGTHHAEIDAKGFKWEMAMCKLVYKKLGMKWKEPETKIVPRQAVEFDPEIETYDDL
jgi:hypothetical protein